MPTIVIVDDQSFSRNTLVRLSEDFAKDIQTEAFSHPEEALHWLNWFDADLIITSSARQGRPHCFCLCLLCFVCRNA